MNKGHMSKGLALLSAALLLASCGGNGDHTSSTGTGSTSTGSDSTDSEYVPYFGELGEHETINITLWTTAGETSQPILDKYVEGFAELEPNIHVTNEKISGNYDQLKDQITTGFSSGTYPDIAYAYPDHVAEYIYYGNAVNLDNYINDPIYGWTEEDKNDLIASFVEEGTEYSVPGTYSVPFSKSTEAMFYNPALIGIDLSDYDATINNGAPLSENYLNNLTWDELFEHLCPALVAYNNSLTDKIWIDSDPHSAIVGYDSDDNFFITLAEQYGYAYTSIGADGRGQVEFNNDGMKELMKMLNNAAQNKYLTTQGAAGDYVNTLSNERKVLFSIGSTGGITHQQPTGDAWAPRVARVPQAPTGNGHKIALMSQGPSMVILQHMNNGVVDADRIMAGWLFYRYMTTTDNCTEWALNSTGYMPIRVSSMESETYQNAYSNQNEGDVLGLIARGMIYYSNVSNYMFTSEAFVGSSECRTQAGSIVQQMVSADHELTDTEISSIFEEAENLALAAIR